ncbi:MAG TPA: hypothetical protein VIB78_10510 [Acidimicrobiia bacterium]
MRRPQSELADSDLVDSALAVDFSAVLVELSDLEPLLSLDELPFSDEAFALTRESVA